MKHIKFLVALTVMFLVSACYKDLGNYDYNENIQGVDVTIDNVYSVKKEKTDFSISIKPVIDTKGADKELSYEWFRSTDSQIKGERISTEQNLTMLFKPNSQDPKDRLSSEYHVRLYVTDKSTNTVTMRHTRVILVDPYRASWAVLHEQDGHAEIGTIEYLGKDIVTTPDTYTKEQGTSLQGKPLHLGVRPFPNSYVVVP